MTCGTLSKGECIGSCGQTTGLGDGWDWEFSSPFFLDLFKQGYCSILTWLSLEADALATGSSRVASFVPQHQKEKNSSHQLYSEKSHLGQAGSPALPVAKETPSLPRRSREQERGSSKEQLLRRLTTGVTSAKHLTPVGLSLICKTGE